MVADPLASTFWSQLVRDPYTSAIRNPSSAATTPTGVSYGRPEVRPRWRITDAYAPGVPADRICFGLMTARWSRMRGLSTSGDFVRMPSRNTSAIATTPMNRAPARVATCINIGASLAGCVACYTVS